jgi:hypothetical protein
MGLPIRQRIRHHFLWDFDTTNTSADSTAATGTIVIFSAPANTQIHKVQADVITAVTGATSEIVGDGTDTNGYLEDAFAASAGVYPLYHQDVATTFCGLLQLDSTAGVTDAADVTIQPKDLVYSSADTIDYIIGGTATAGKIRFTVELTRLR